MKLVGIYYIVTDSIESFICVFDLIWYMYTKEFTVKLLFNNYTNIPQSILYVLVCNSP